MPWLLPRASAERPPASDPADPAARLERASKRLGSTPALVDVSAAFGRGVVTAVTGPNGAGKTTLALAACGLMDLDSGTAVANGPGRIRRARTRRATCSTTRRSRRSSTASRTSACHPAPAASRAVAELERFELAWAATEHPRDLSSGERQRLAIATVTAMRPDLVVLDEPTRGVDGRRKRDLAGLVRGLAAAGAGGGRREPRRLVRRRRRRRRRWPWTGGRIARRTAPAVEVVHA